MHAQSLAYIDPFAHVTPLSSSLQPPHNATLLHAAIMGQCWSATWAAVHTAMVDTAASWSSGGGAPRRRRHHSPRASRRRYRAMPDGVDDDDDENAAERGDASRWPSRSGSSSPPASSTTRRRNVRRRRPGLAEQAPVEPNDAPSEPSLPVSAVGGAAGGGRTSPPPWLILCESAPPALCRAPDGTNTNATSDELDHLVTSGVREIGETDDDPCPLDDDASSVPVEIDVGVGDDDSDKDGEGEQTWCSICYESNTRTTTPCCGKLMCGSCARACAVRFRKCPYCTYTWLL